MKAHGAAQRTSTVAVAEMQRHQPRDIAKRVACHPQKFPHGTYAAERALEQLTVALHCRDKYHVGWLHYKFIIG